MCGRPFECKSKTRLPAIMSIAVMCPACWRGVMAAGPDGFRDPVPSKPAASKAIDRNGFSGSTVRPIVISFSFHILASTGGGTAAGPCRPCFPARYLGPCRMGHAAV